MNQVDLRENGCDFFINMTDRDIEVSFPDHVEIEEAVDKTIKTAQEFGCKAVLVFDGRRFLIGPDTKPWDVMEKYIFEQC